MKPTRKKEKVPKTPPLDEVWALLEKNGWLAERAADVCDRLRSIARVRSYRRGEPLYIVGEPSNGVFGIAKGALDISIPREDGQEVMFHRAQPGFWIGDLALFSAQPRLVTASAATDVVAVFLPKAPLARLLEQNPEMGLDFYMLSHRNVATMLQLMSNLSIPRAEARVALRLLSYDQQSTKKPGWIPLSQEKLAQLTALSLPTVQRTLRNFVATGLVELGYGRLRILDRKQLLRHCS